ncbi:MAG: hypothetical protein JWQ35_2268 [Bacteriovoracaceae bacterium]|nr:hypothetical protein [Bacteriovoracaceae bacterium]
MRLLVQHISWIWIVCFGIEGLYALPPGKPNQDRACQLRLIDLAKAALKPIRRDKFDAGEFVQIKDKEIIAATGMITTGMITSDAIAIPGRVIRYLPDGKIQIKHVSHRQLVESAIAPENIRGLQIGSTEKFEEVLKIFNNAQLKFKTGEVVRVRNPQGFIFLGKISKKLRGNRFEISVKTAEGEKKIERSAEELSKFKDGDYYPMTVTWIPQSASESKWQPGGDLQKVLNAAARFTSTDEFVQASAREKLDLLVSFVRVFMGPHMVAAESDKFGFPNIDTLFAPGMGCCRHKTQLLAMIMGELGYKIEVAVKHVEGLGGHTWLIVDTEGKRFVLDARDEAGVFEREEVYDLAKGEKPPDEDFNIHKEFYAGTAFSSDKEIPSFYWSLPLNIPK